MHVSFILFLFYSIRYYSIIFHSFILFVMLLLVFQNEIFPHFILYWTYNVWKTIRLWKQRQVNARTARENNLRVDHDYAVGDKVLITDRDTISVSKRALTKRVNIRICTYTIQKIEQVWGGNAVVLVGLVKYRTKLNSKMYKLGYTIFYHYS